MTFRLPRALERGLPALDVRWAIVGTACAIALASAPAACGGASSELSPPSLPEEGGGAPSSPTAAPVTPPRARPMPLPPSGKYYGATPVERGVEFRVWAPNARAVAVVGEAAAPASTSGATATDGGVTARHELAAEGGAGVFAGRIETARAGQRYRYEITTSDGKRMLKVDPRARGVDGPESVIVDPRTFEWKAKDFVPPSREEAVVYEMHVGSFHAPSGPGSGTFSTAIDKLDALAELGVNVVELMPVNGFGGHGWGYNPQQWFAPHARYGKPDDLRRFVDAAHVRGIAVVLDVVFNHYDGWKEAPLRCFDGACPDGGAGVYFFEQEPYRATPWGPRPDFAKKEVADYFADNVFAWTVEYKIDGFRHDSVSNVRGIDGKGSVPGGVELSRRMNDVTLAAQPRALLIAEDLKGQAGITASASAGGLGYHAQWDGGFEWAVRSAASAANDDARNLGAVRDALVGSYNGDPFQRLLYVESHDTAGNDGARLPARIDGKNPTSYAARKRAMLAAGVLLTAPGVPMMFMGQEMLETTKFEPQPAPLDWSKATTHAKIVAFYKDLVRLRRNIEGKSGGLRGKNVAVTHLNDGGGNKVLAYRRWSAPSDDVMVVANFGATRYTRYDIGVPEGTWHARVDSDAKRYGDDFGSETIAPVVPLGAPRDGLPASVSIALGPYSMVVLTR